VIIIIIIEFSNIAIMQKTCIQYVDLRLFSVPFQKILKLLK